MSAHTYSLITIGSNNEAISSTLIGLSADPAPLEETGEDERRRRLVEVFRSPLDVVKVLGIPAGEDGRD